MSCSNGIEPGGGMHIASHRRNETVVLELFGRFDFRARKVFRDALDTARQDSPRAIVLDFGQALFIDSAALGLLALWQTRLYGEGLTLRLAGARGYVREVFELFHIDRLIPTFSTVEEAVRAPVTRTSFMNPMPVGPTHGD